MNDEELLEIRLALVKQLCRELGVRRTYARYPNRCRGLNCPITFTVDDTWIGRAPDGKYYCVQCAIAMTPDWDDVIDKILTTHDRDDHQH